MARVGVVVFPGSCDEADALGAVNRIPGLAGEYLWHGDSDLRGVEAVIDKDLSAALLAHRLKADRLLVLTDVEAVIEGYGTDDERPIHRTTPAQLRELDLPAGSMGPKVEAVCRFVELGGKGVAGAIGNLGDVLELVHGEAGTFVTAED